MAFLHPISQTQTVEKTMDLEVVGRHALLFDDDANAALVNSDNILVQWNTLLIDRYDVRHFLSGPPPRRNRRRHSSSPPVLPDDSLESDLDRERYLDLPPLSDEQEQDVGKDVEPVVNGGYHAVAFGYGNPDEATEQKNSDVESVFRPPFPVPESLVHNLPPTEKLHQIIARTATFVSKHGGQSEIVLRVKQGDNPTFGFLMPDHHLHAYFRFLVDHQELLKSDVDGKSLEEEKKGDNEPDRTGGALSLLGSVYGSGEDEEGATEDPPEANAEKSLETVDAVSATVSHGSEKMESSGNETGKNDVVSSNTCPLKEKVHVIKRNQSISTVKSGTTSGLKRDGNALGSIDTATNKSQAPAVPSMAKAEVPILEPPSDLKRVVDKIVEFILRNGKEFEAVLAEQDRQFGRFPFLLPSNQYHPYYIKVLQKTQESKLAGKGCVSEKHESTGHGMDKKTALGREGDKRSSGSADNDIPYDYDKKEKFRMVLGKSKKDVEDPPPKVNQSQTEVTLDADVAAAILKAATRGIKNPNLDLFPKLSLGVSGQGPSDEAGQSLSFGSLHSSQPQSSIQKRDAVGQPSVSVPVAKAIAETAARAAASEADSSEASLTKEQKLKAERLKRAKMFAAMIKSGAAPLKSEPLGSLSVEPPGSGVSSSGNEVLNPAGKEREGSSVPVDFDASDKIEKSENKSLVDESHERRSKRSYRSRSKRHEEDEEEEEEEEEEDKRDHKHSRKKHRSHRSSRHNEDKHKHRKRHSSSKDKDSRHSHKPDSEEYFDDEDRYSRHRHKYSSSSDEHRSSRRRRKHRSSSDDEHQHTRHRHKHDGSSEDEYEQTRHRHKRGGSHVDEGWHRSRSVKHRKHRSEREAELEEGEISAKSDQSKANESDRASRETSIDLLKSSQHGSASSQPSESTEVSDELRAKIRAMLMATL